METQKIQDIIRTLLGTLTVEVEDISYIADALHPIFSVKTPDAKKLIGTKGENLRALNYLVKRLAEKQLGMERPTFLVDVNHYQQQRNEEVRRKAKILIERARAFKTSAEFGPLNAYERMVVHSMVADDPQITTESIGEGRVKTIVIRYVEEVDGVSRELLPESDTNVAK